VSVRGGFLARTLVIISARDDRAQRGSDQRGHPIPGTDHDSGAAAAQATGHVEIKAADLMMILDGVDLGSVRRRRCYS
jgi:hypothetical protein